MDRPLFWTVPPVRFSCLRDEATLKEYTAKREEYLAEKAALQAFVGKQSVTADGHVVEAVRKHW